MKKLFVPIEIAKQLKKKGFNEPCLGGYSNIVKNYFRLFGGNLKKTMRNRDFSNRIFCAPTYQQVVDWFREKHKIQIKVIAFDTNSKVKWYYECQDLTLVKTKHSKDLVFKFKVATPNISNTYYNALDKAIKEALKLIKK